MTIILLPGSKLASKANSFLVIFLLKKIIFCLYKEKKVKNHHRQYTKKEVPRQSKKEPIPQKLKNSRKGVWMFKKSINSRGYFCCTLRENT